MAIKEAFSIWQKKIDDLSIESRRSKLRIFADYGVDTYEIIKLLLDEDKLLYASEFYYFAYLASLNKNIELQSSYDMLYDYVERSEDKTTLIVSFLIGMDTKELKKRMKSYFNSIPSRRELPSKVVRKNQVGTFCQEILPYLCFSEASDNLFVILYTLLSVGRRTSHYCHYCYIVINSWVKYSGNTQRPVTETGRLSLIRAAYALVVDCDFTSLNRILYSFPMLDQHDLFDKSFEEFISDVPQYTLDNPNSAIFYLNSFKRAYADELEGYEQWLKLFSRSIYYNEVWFKSLSYLERVNIDRESIDDPVYDFGPGKKEPSFANKIDYEVLEIFPKVLLEKPQHLLRFLKNISSINSFQYSDEPQIFMDSIKKPITRLYLSKAFIENYEDIILGYFSSTDLFRIYINSPLSQASKVEDLIERLNKRGLEIDVSKTPLSQVLYKGFIYYSDDGCFFCCSKLSDRDLRVTEYSVIRDGDREIIEASKSYNRCVIVTYLRGFKPHEYVNLEGVSVIHGRNSSIDEYTVNLRYLEEKKEKHSEMIENSPYLFNNSDHI